MLAFLARFFTGGVLDRIFDTVDKRIDSETDRNKVKADLLIAYQKNRGDWMRAGGFWLSLIFVVPLGFWYASVCVYSVFWCAGCIYPQEWTIAALPEPLDTWAGAIIVSIFGVVGLDRLKR
jgi:hypothetical protein